MRFSATGRHVERLSFDEVLPVFTLAQLRAVTEKLDGYASEAAAKEALRQVTRRGTHLGEVVAAAFRRSHGNDDRALELVNVYYHLVRDVVVRNMHRNGEQHTPGAYMMTFQSYAMVILWMDDILDVVDHLSPGDEVPVELIGAFFL